MESGSINDETFAAYKNKMAILMKEKSKMAKKANKIATNEKEIAEWVNSNPL